MYAISNDQSFNNMLDMLTNNIVSSEQLQPGPRRQEAFADAEVISTSSINKYEKRVFRCSILPGQAYM